MKLTVFCINGLNTSSLAYLRLATLDEVAFHDIASVIPFRPVTAWTSAWTGVGPAVHGRAPGIRGKKPKIDTIWDSLQQQGMKVAIYDEEQFGAEDEEADVVVYRLDSVADSLINDDLGAAQASLNLLDDCIASLGDVPYLIISAVGTAKYTTSLNVDRLLAMRNLMLMDEKGWVQYEQTYAYPINFNGKKPRDTYGILINTDVRENGFVEMAHATDIQGELLMQLNRVDGIDAVASHMEFDIAGRFYMDMPDIVLKSPLNRTCFRCVGGTEYEVVCPYGHFGLSQVGMIASNADKVVDGIISVTDVPKAVRRAVASV